MDFPALPETPDVSWAPVTMVIGFGLLLVCALTVVLISNARNAEKLAPPLFVGLGVGALTFIIGIGAMVVSMNASVSALAEWKDEAIAEVEDTYGIDLTEDEFFALQFPKHEPKQDFVKYGSIERAGKTDDPEALQLTLVWSDGSLLLAESVNGEEFTALEAR